MKEMRDDTCAVPTCPHRADIGGTPQPAIWEVGFDHTAVSFRDAAERMTFAACDACKEAGMADGTVIEFYMLGAHPDYPQE